MIKKLVVTFFLLVGVLSAGGWYWYQSELDKPLLIAEDGLVVQVKPGDSLTKVLQGLVDAGALSQIWSAKIYARQHALASQIKVGEFLLPSGIALPALFKILSSNEQIRYRVTLVEGSTFAEAVDILRSEPRLDHKLQDMDVQQVWALVRDGFKGDGLLPGDVFWEGMLYPDTYFFHRGDSDLSVLIRSYERLQHVLASEWAQKAEDLPIKLPYEALILASIVEKETGKPDERAEIAGVFTRRLEKNMRLQTDPTVIYGLGDRYAGNITRQHLKEKTPYNTYRINGLPPTPIALVGREAINAALNPKAGKSLYFVAKGDGSHQFSDTIDQHNRAVRKYQLKRRVDYRSTHQLPGKPQ